MEREKRYFVYMLRCADNTFYIGYTVDSVQDRIRVHNQGLGAKYTRGRVPVKLAYFEECKSKSDVMKRERALKTFSRSKKMALEESFFGSDEQSKALKEYVLQEKSNEKN